MSSPLAILHTLMLSNNAMVELDHAVSVEKLWPPVAAGRRLDQRGMR